MPVNITIPTAVMITCDGDQFPVGISLEAQNSSNQPGTYIPEYIFIFHTLTKSQIKEALFETMLFTQPIHLNLIFEKSTLKLFPKIKLDELDF